MTHPYRGTTAGRKAGTWGPRASVAAGVLALAIGVACGKSDKVTGPAGQLHTIVVTPGSDTIAVGGSRTFTATGQDAAGHTVSGVTFFWSSSDTTVAKVTQSGSVTTISTGQVQIAASVRGVSGFATLTVSSKPVGSIVIVPSSATLRIATTLQLGDTVKDASGNPLSGQAVAWTSDSAPIVSVDGKGLVTARALGVAHITATSGGKSARTTITVSQVPVASVTIAPTTPTAFVGQTTDLSAITKDSANNVLPGRVVRWTSSAPSIASIDSVSGVLTGVGPGTAFIRARSEGIVDSVPATVSNAPPNAVVLSPSVSQVDVGQTVTLTGVVTNALGNPIVNPTISFSSDKTTVASLTSETGATGQFLAGPNAGTATITGTSGAANGTATIIVSLVGVDSVNISAARDTLTPGQSETLTATAFDSSGHPLTGRPVTWQSSNTAVATVNGSGSVTAQSTGVAVIFATISGVKGSLALVVNPVPIGSITITPSSDTLEPLGTIQLNATVRDINGTVVANPPANWYSTNTNIAVVGANGLVTGLRVGTAAIIDSTGGKADTNTTLVVAPVASVTINFSTTAHPDTLSAGATPGFDTSDSATATLLDTSGADVSASHMVTWTSTGSTFLVINGQASVMNVRATTPVTLSAVANAGLPTTVGVVATTTDGVTDTLQITILP